MSFQTIFNIQQSMTVNNRRMIGQTYSRAGQVYVSQYLTIVPWVFTVYPHPYASWKYARGYIQQIANLDRQTPEQIIFNHQGYADLSWYTRYGGSWSTPVTGITVAATPPANATSIDLTTLPGGGGVAFAQGDFIEFGGHVYNVTQTVYAGAATITVPLHRPVIGTVAAGAAVAVGNEVQFNLIADQCPTYSLNAAPDSGFVEWSSPFVFREYMVTT
jgi:hypothetical protein